MNFAKVELIHITKDCDRLLEEAGRTCYKSNDKITDESTAKFVDKILRDKHLSVIEHASATFRITNVSRSLTHQLVRHRLASYSQQSQRYVPAENFEYIIPPAIKKNKEALEVYQDCINKISESYKILKSYKIKKEDCRFLLPNATCTEIVVTMNFRTWQHFFEERLSEGAQWEIKIMAIRILNILQQHSRCFMDLELLKQQAITKLQEEGICF